MKAKYIITLLSLGGLLLTVSCKESSSKRSRSGGGSSGDPAEKEYVLYQSEQPLPVGAVQTKTNRMNMEKAKITMVAEGQNLAGTMSRRGEKIKVLTVDSDTQVTVEIKKNEDSGGGVIGGQQIPESTEKDPLHGKTVVITKTDGKWTAKLKSGTDDPAENEALDKMSESMNEPDEKIILGTEPRKLGDSWDVDPTKLKSFGGTGSDNLTGTYRVTFASIKKYEGQNCAELVADINLKGKADKGMNMRMVGKITVLHSLELHTGLSFKMDGTVTMDGANSLHVEGPMIVNGKATIKLP